MQNIARLSKAMVPHSLRELQEQDWTLSVTTSSVPLPPREQTPYFREAVKWPMSKCNQQPAHSFRRQQLNRQWGKAVKGFPCVEILFLDIFCSPCPSAGNQWNPFPQDRKNFRLLETNGTPESAFSICSFPYSLVHRVTKIWDSPLPEGMAELSIPLFKPGTQN